MAPKPVQNDSQSADLGLRDIVALATLPAMWTGADPLRVAESLAAALFTILDPEFVYVFFTEGPGRPSVAVAQTDRYQTSPALAEHMSPAILEWARAHDPDELLLLLDPLDPLNSGKLRIATRPLGYHAELGVIAAAFRDDRAPTPMHHLALNVGASQATTAIQNVHLLHAVREGKERLHHTNVELAKRVTELQRANCEIRASRRAALNVMDDAVRAQDTLRRRTAQFETLLNQAPLGVYLVDADFKVRQVNPTARLAWSGIPDAGVGREFTEVIRIIWNEKVAGEIVRMFRRTLKTGESYAVPELIDVRADRKITEYYEWRIDRIELPDGRYGVVCYFRDISARVLAQQKIEETAEALRESRAALEFALESAQVGDWDLDLIHDTSRRSLRHDQCFGYTDPIPESEWGFETFIRHVHSDDRPRIERQFREAVRALQDWHFECRIVWPNESVHWIAAHGCIYRTVEGTATRMLGIVADITNRK